MPTKADVMLARKAQARQLGRDCKETSIEAALEACPGIYVHDFLHGWREAHPDA